MTLQEILDGLFKIKEDLTETKNKIKELKKEAKILEKSLKKISNTEFDGDLKFIFTKNGKTFELEVTSFNTSLTEIFTAEELDKKRMLNKLKGENPPITMTYTGPRKKYIRKKLTAIWKV